jgi:glycosyltransferase involved in cell wall biosynthesis
MNVLVIHNKYRERGGEDRVVELETALLRRHGHTIVQYVLDNSAIDGMNPLVLAGRTVWNGPAHRETRRLIARERIDLVHVHNTLPLASPSVYYAASAAGIPVVQTLHNYRLLCPNAVLLRDGKPCVSCVGTAPLPAIRHRCYRGSSAATTTVAAMLLFHRALGTWQRRIAAYVAPTEFARAMFVAGGLPADRIRVKPHFVDPDPGPGTGRGGYALYVGRLSPEKGIETLLAAWTRLRTRIPLTIVGDGPMAPVVADAAARLDGVSWLGRRTQTEVQALMGDAALLVFPSVFYETFGQVVIEAYAAGTPVLASSGGTADELVTPGRTGVLVRAGDAADLSAAIDRLFSSPGDLAAMRPWARAAYTARFTAGANYDQLMTIYRDAAAEPRSQSVRPGVDYVSTAGEVGG